MKRIVIEWPQSFRNTKGESRVFNTPQDVEPGWMTTDQFAALDHDGKGPMGGAKPRKAAK
jgi:hypothetical protein